MKEEEVGWSGGSLGPPPRVGVVSKAGSQMSETMMLGVRVYRRTAVVEFEVVVQVGVA